MKTSTMPEWMWQQVHGHIEHSFPIRGVRLEITTRDPDYESLKKHHVSFEARHKTAEEATPVQIMVTFCDPIPVQEVENRYTHFLFVQDFIKNLGTILPDLVYLNVQGKEVDFFEHYELRAIDEKNPLKDPYTHLIDHFKYYLIEQGIK